MSVAIHLPIPLGHFNFGSCQTHRSCYKISTEHTCQTWNENIHVVPKNKKNKHGKGIKKL